MTSTDDEIKKRLDAKREAVTAMFADHELKNLDKLVGVALIYVYDHTVTTGDCFPVHQHARQAVQHRTPANRP